LANRNLRVAAAVGAQNPQQIAPPGQRGLINELILPFFYSLLPTWQPNTHQEAAPAPPVEQVAPDAPDLAQ